MTREDALTRLRAHEAELRALGASAMFLFGSTARGEARPDSDVDVLIDVDRESFGPFSLCDLSRLRRGLAERVGGPVDVLTRSGLRPRFAARVARDLRRVY